MEDKDTALASTGLRIHLLGGFSVWSNGKIVPATAWRRKSAALVKLLALSPKHSMHREEVLEHLWPELSFKAAANNLHQILHAARRTLSAHAPQDYLCLHGELLTLCPGKDLWIDMDAFTSAARKARTTQKREDYEAATDLYGGELLPEDRFEDWATTLREDLLELYLALETELSALYEQSQNYPAAKACLQRILAKEPVLETVHQKLMRLYTLTGEPHKALEQYEKLRRALRRDLGVAPSRESKDLFHSLLISVPTPAENDRASSWRASKKAQEDTL